LPLWRINGKFGKIAGKSLPLPKVSITLNIFSDPDHLQLMVSMEGRTMGADGNDCASRIWKGE
jgi:hypothetical protein